MFIFGGQWHRVSLGPVSGCGREHRGCCHRAGRGPGALFPNPAARRSVPMKTRPPPRGLLCRRHSNRSAGTTLRSWTPEWPCHPAIDSPRPVAVHHASRSARYVRRWAQTASQSGGASQGKVAVRCPNQPLSRIGFPVRSQRGAPLPEVRPRPFPCTARQTKIDKIRRSITEGEGREAEAAGASLGRGGRPGGISGKLEVKSSASLGLNLSRLPSHSPALGWNARSQGFGNFDEEAAAALLDLIPDTESGPIGTSHRGENRFSDRQLAPEVAEHGQAVLSQVALNNGKPKAS